MAEISSMTKMQENHIRHADLFAHKRNDTITIDTFYRLLMAEMSNQDPLDPMSNTDFIAQMANFTSLQVQQDALYFNNSNYAASMTGRTVIVASSTGTGLDVVTGVVTRVNFTGGEFQVTVDGKEYPLKNVMEILDSTQGAANGNDGAFATSLIGKYVTVGWFNSSGSPVIESGIVERIEIKDRDVSVIINGVAYPLRAVAKIEPPEAMEVDDGSSQPGGITPGDDD
jgi:flagellar basal-body rod modification protein FlgD